MTIPAKERRVLVVDDAPMTVELIERNLVSVGYQVATASSVDEALVRLGDGPYDLVITDLKMPKTSGMELVRVVAERYPMTGVMMITGYPTIEGAVEAVKVGAEEYLTKPFTDEELFAAVDRAMATVERRRVVTADHTITTSEDFGLIGTSKVMARVRGLIAKAARSNATLLVTGESGTGKELVARAVHYHGPRARAPFVPVNCGGIPEQLLESELFGHTKGAFTGAVETRAGFFATADKGTIFLDEVGEMSLSMQVKLLRALQSKEITMVGATKPLRVDVRIIAATNKDLGAMVSRGQFREDLYYRLNVLPIELPPLRARGDDVIALLSHMAGRMADEQGTPPPTFSDDALAALCRYGWPGNVRELMNIVQRLIVMADGPSIGVADLPDYMKHAVPTEVTLSSTLAEVEAAHIARVLAAVDGNKTRAAEILDIDRKTLREKLKRSRTSAP